MLSLLLLMMTVCAFPFAPRHVRQLAPSGRAVLAGLQREFPQLTEGELLGFFHRCRGDANQTRGQVQRLLAWRAQRVTIADVAPHLRANASMFVLEGPGWCARDKRGRPVIVSAAAIGGSDADVARQVQYAAQRLREHVDPGAVPCALTVVDAVRQLPGRSARLLLRLQQEYYPGSLEHGEVHVCGVPGWAHSLCRLVAPTAFLAPDRAHLNEYVRPVMWPPGGGPLCFDVEQYIAWRAAEENVCVGK